MSTVVEGPAPERTRSKRDYPIIDCDVHPMMNSPKQLAPYLSAAWRERLNIGEYHQPTRRVPRGWYFPGQVDGNRMDAFPEGGGNAGSDQALMVKQVFEEAGIGYAALMANQTLFLGGVASADLAATVVSAFNDWIVNEWLTFDDRFRGSIAVTPQDPARAAAEIRRLAENPKMIQIFVATPSTHRLGNPFFDPIWDAAQEVGLPVVWHPGGGTRAAASAARRRPTSRASRRSRTPPRRSSAASSPRACSRSSRRSSSGSSRAGSCGCSAPSGGCAARGWPTATSCRG